MLHGSFAIDAVIRYGQDVQKAKYLGKECEFSGRVKVLDVGCGKGLQGRIIKDYGNDVVGLTIRDKEDSGAGYNGQLLDNVIYEDFLTYTSKEKFDIIWASHILEHISDISAFISSIRRNIRKGGMLALTVPAMDHNVLLAHIHYFNAGYLLRNLVVNGIDCRDAMIKVYDYNLSIIIPSVSNIKAVEITGNKIEKQIACMEKENSLFQYFPREVEYYKNWNGEFTFDGNIYEMNWKVDTIY